MQIEARLGHHRFAASLAGLCLAALLCGCSRKPDLTQPFAMVMDGAEYRSRLGDPVAYIDEQEAGFSTSCRYTVLYPLRLPSGINKPGLQITIDPQRVTLGQEITFAAGDTERGVRLEYVPQMGHQMSKGILLAFSSTYGEGSCAIRIDQMDSQLGGRITGKLLRASLYGYKENAHTGELIRLPEPRKLELANFSFDVPLQRLEEALVRQASLSRQPE
jgi:hypothetical protein